MWVIVANSRDWSDSPEWSNISLNSDTIYMCILSETLNPNPK